MSEERDETHHFIGDGYYVRWYFREVEIRDNRADYVAMSPHTALALLAWLEKQRPLLERITQEQSE